MHPAELCAATRQTVPVNADMGEGGSEWPLKPHNLVESIEAVARAKRERG